MKKNQQGFGLIGVLIIIVVLAGIAVAGWLVYDKQKDKNDANSSSNSPSTSQSGAIDSFDECVAAGNPVMESFPEQCMANGKTFVNDGNSTSSPSGATQPGVETFTGKLTCLPKPGGDNVTLECAIGLQTADQKNYALKNNPKYDLPMDTQVTVKGVFTPAGDNEPYLIVGTIDVKEIEKTE